MYYSRALLAAVAMASVATGCSATDDAPDKYDAQVMCEQFVEDRLKSPGSADFNDTTATGGGNTWHVTGTVDSQNGFGALVRSEFMCNMSVSGETWTLEDFNFEDGGSR